MPKPEREMYEEVEALFDLKVSSSGADITIKMSGQQITVPYEDFMLLRQGIEDLIVNYQSQRLAAEFEKLSMPHQMLQRHLCKMFLLSSRSQDYLAIALLHHVAASTSHLRNQDLVFHLALLGLCQKPSHRRRPNPYQQHLLQHQQRMHELLTPLLALQKKHLRSILIHANKHLPVHLEVIPMLLRLLFDTPCSASYHRQ